MPNPHPVRRVKPDAPTTLPPGFTATHRAGLLRYRWTEPGGLRRTVYGHTPDACYAQRYAPPRPAPSPDSPTLAAWLRTWVAGLDLRASTVANHRQVIESRLVPLFGESITLAQLDRELIKARMADLRTWPARGGGTLSAQSIQLTYSTLRTALFAAVDSTPPRLAANPAARIKPNGTTGRAAQGKRVGVELAIPTELEVRRLIHASRSHPWGALVPLAAFTGLRQGEALALTAESIDTTAHWVHVTGSISRTTRADDGTKNHTSQRFVPFHPALAPVLAAQLRERDRLAVVHDYAPGLLWSRADGSPLVGTAVSQWFAQLCEAAQVPHYRYHDLRHYYASGLLNRGAPLAVVAKLLGHADATITSRVYHHATRNDDLGLAAMAGDGLAAALG